MSTKKKTAKLTSVSGAAGVGITVVKDYDESEAAILPESLVATLNAMQVISTVLLRPDQHAEFRFELEAEDSVMRVFGELLAHENKEAA